MLGLTPGGDLGSATELLEWASAEFDLDALHGGPDSYRH